MSMRQWQVTDTHVHVRGGQKVKQLLTLRAGAGLQIVGEGVSQGKGIVGDWRLLATSGRAYLLVDLQIVDGGPLTLLCLHNSAHKGLSGLGLYIHGLRDGGARCSSVFQ